MSDIVLSGRSLDELESVIERGLATFVEVGQALLEIREGRAYRETHDSFETYCRERWGFNDRRAQQLIQAAEISTIVEIAPKNEAQARELARLKDEPEAVREVWSEVTEAKGEKVTAADVRAAVDRRLYPFSCAACGQRFDIEVWHCPVCAHHWPDAGSPCKNCLSVGHYEYPPGYEPTEDDLEPCACARCYRPSDEPITDGDGEQYATLPLDAAIRQMVDAAPIEILTATPAQQATLRAMADAEHLLREPDEERAFYMVGKQRVWMRLSPELVAETSSHPTQDAPEWEAFAAWCSQVATALRRRSSQPFRVIG